MSMSILLLGSVAFLWKDLYKKLCINHNAFVIDIVKDDNGFLRYFNVGLGTIMSINEILTIFKEKIKLMPNIKYIAYKNYDVINFELGYTKYNNLFHMKYLPIEIWIDKLLKKILIVSSIFE